jgi:ABC-type sugar transport system substrate-binding protein
MDPVIREMASQVSIEQVSGEGDPKKQIQEIDDAIAKKPNVLLVSPIDKTVLPALAKAKAAGIFVFQLDRCYVPFFTSKTTPTDSFYGTDLVGVGSIGPFQYDHMLGLKGTGLVIPDNSSETGKELFHGIDFAFKKYKNDLKLVMGEDCGTDESKAKAFVAAYFKSGKRADAIFTENEATTLGAAEAVKEAGVKTYLFGIGGSIKKVFDAVKNGSVYAIFTVPPGGPAALEEIPTALKHQRVPKNSFMPFDEVLKRNADKYLQDHPMLGD